MHQLVNRETKLGLSIQKTTTQKKNTNIGYNMNEPKKFMKETNAEYYMLYDSFYIEDPIKANL